MRLDALLLGYRGLFFRPKNFDTCHLCCEAQRRSRTSFSESDEGESFEKAELVSDRCVSLLDSLRRLSGSCAVGAEVRAGTGFFFTISSRSATLGSHRNISFNLALHLSMMKLTSIRTWATLSDTTTDDIVFPKLSKRTQM